MAPAVYPRLSLVVLTVLPSATQACAGCITGSPYAKGLIIGTLMMIPIPLIIIYMLVRQAKKGKAGQTPDPFKSSENKTQ